jgi:hypothetical protein
MKSPLFAKLRSLWIDAGRWYETTPERSLNEAYEAALAIVGLENRYFDGDPIDLQSDRYSTGVRDYFRIELRKHLKTIEVRLFEFRASAAYFRRSLLPPESEIWEDSLGNGQVYGDDRPDREADRNLDREADRNLDRDAAAGTAAPDRTPGGEPWGEPLGEPLGDREGHDSSHPNAPANERNGASDRDGGWRDRPPAVPPDGSRRPPTGSPPTAAMPVDGQGRRFAAPDDRPFILFKKLEFIDSVLARYDRLRDPLPGDTRVPERPVAEAARAEAARANPPRANGAALRPPAAANGRRSGRGQPTGTPIANLRVSEAIARSGRRPPNWRAGAVNLPRAIGSNAGMSDRPVSDRTSFLPRSLLGTLDRVRRDLDDRSEEEVLQSYRSSKIKTIVSLKFVLLLILVPLLTQQLFKNFLVGPIVDHFYHPPVESIFLNADLEEEALVELEHYEHLLRFRSLVGQAPPINEEALEVHLKEKAEEIAEESLAASANAIKNIISDFLSLLGFAAVIIYSREEIAILKSFIDEIMYGLSDSAKAFVIILSTDIFVGYHSTHGWEVIVAGISRHLGLPENRDFMFLFIATFPVILDAVIKYWIFRYLNRISPSAVATYKTMNE